MTAHVCPQCGAQYAVDGDSCAERFNTLLALDHSRSEPWGSRHGSAFAVFTLQHPTGHAPEVLERCWTLLCRIYVAGDDPRKVARALRRQHEGGPRVECDRSLPAGASEPREFPITIADLGDFDADGYPRLLEEWCRTTLQALTATQPGA